MSREPNFQQQRIRFDWTITAGNLLTVLGGLIAMAAAYIDYRVTVDRHDMRIGANELAVTQLRAQMQQQITTSQEMTRALDRLTYQLQKTN